MNANAPGWYDEWEHADPTSTEGHLRRTAVLGGVLPRHIRVTAHSFEGILELTGDSGERHVEITLAGTDAEMREQLAQALIVLEKPAGA